MKTPLRTLSALALSLALSVGLGLGLAPAPARAEDQLNVNTASEQELEALPGVGAATAKRIVEYRDQNGPFENLEDLQKVRGISPAALEKLRPYLVAGRGGGSGRPRAGSETVVASRADSEASNANVKKLLARYKDEPTVRETQEAAMRYAEVHPEVIQSWRSRSRLAGLGPQLRAEMRYVNTLDERVRTGGDSAPTQQNDTGTELRPLARAQWDLDRLIFNPDELRVSNQTVDLVRLRESVLDQVTKVYYERRRLQVDLELAPPGDLAGRLRKELRLQELVADLDALTGGFFSQKLGERGASPY
jgi:competence ComEA-like helix-hairpin-helix protein